MFGGILTALLPTIFSTVFGGLFKTAEKVFDASVITTTATLKYTSAVMVAAMSHTTFWIAWGIAAVPMAAWFGWGMLDTLANGALPDVAAIPPGLKEYSDVVWGNIFYVGAGTATVQSGFSLLGSIFGKR